MPFLVIPRSLLRGGFIIGMTIGLVPIIGLPLPLMSYGGSSLVMTFLCLGLLMNVRMRRFKSGMFPS